MQFIEGQGLDAVIKELKQLREKRLDGSPGPIQVATTERTDSHRAAAVIAESLVTGRFDAVRTTEKLASGSDLSRCRGRGCCTMCPCRRRPDPVVERSESIQHFLPHGW
jgi:hypothetical protein